MNKGLVAAVVPLVVGLLVLIASLFGTESGKEVSQVKTLYDRVGALEDKYREVQLLNQKQTEKIAKLTIELATKYAPDLAVKEFMDNAPFPAWTKIAGEGGTIPVMWHINSNYELDYKVSKEFYVGKTDYQVWPLEVADGFYKTDLFVLQNLIGTCEEESIKYTPTGPLLGPLKDEPPTSVMICKWPTKIMGKLAIAGVVLPKGGGG